MKHRTSPLPPALIKRYQGWKATTFADNASWFRHLADEGQHPRAMVVACCDSRVNVGSMFGADSGEFFIHRNVANLVPPYAPDSDHHGTSAAVEYAVQSLKVANLVVMGHSGCGGVAGCDAMCSGAAPELEDKTSFVGRWMDILRPGFERVKTIEDKAQRLRALEHQAVLTSLTNLLSFPFVGEAVDEGRLSLHGLWVDLGAGELHQYEPAKQGFATV